MVDLYHVTNGKPGHSSIPLRDNSGVGKTDVKIKDYIVMNGVLYFFQVSCLFGLFLHI